MKRFTPWFLVLGPQAAMAQGITNPAGGGLIPVAFHIFIGLLPLTYVFLSLAYPNKTSRTPVLTIRNSLILAFLIIGFGEISISDHHEVVLILYLEMLLIIVGMIFLLFRGAAFRVLAIGGLVAFVVLLNFLPPKLIDFQSRIYIDNERDIDFLELAYPGHWREMHLENNTVLLNINRHKSVGGTMRLIADANRIKSPIALGGEKNGERQVIFDVYKPEITRGTWGWTYRPEAFFKIPMLGTTYIFRFENRLMGKALLLDNNNNVNCKYLYEARGEQTPEGAENSYVQWSIESSVDEGSVVTCER